MSIVIPEMKLTPQGLKNVEKESEDIEIKEGTFIFKSTK